MNGYDDFLTALERAIEEAGGPAKLSKLSGIPLNSITRWRKRERSPSLEALIPLLPYLDWPQNTKAVMKRIGEHAPIENDEGENLPIIPVFLQAGAGFPVDFWQREPEKSIPVLAQYYRPEVRALEIVGDSMEPTIKQGAIVGVVPMQNCLVEGGIYLVNRPPFGLVVKRLRSDKNGQLILYSDNPQYEPQPIPFEGYEDIIVGKIVWIWQHC